MSGSVTALRAAVTLSGVTKAFGKRAAVDDVSVAIARGELVALLGPSGCGKTTLLRSIAGLERPDAGRILLDGRDVTHAGVAERGIGFVFQSYALFPHLDVFENVAFGLRRRRVPESRLRARVLEMLGLVGLNDHERHRPSALSGGQRQRVAFARALAVEPKVLLLDEPFAALDVHMRRELRTWLRELHGRAHITTMLVTHDREEAIEIADTIVLMRDAKVVQAGSPDELYDAPKDLFAMRFLGDATALPTPSGEPVYLRPHDVRVETFPFSGSHAGSVRRAARRGSLLRLEVTLFSGHDVVADLPTSSFPVLASAAGTTVYVAPLASITFLPAQEARVS